MPRRGHAQGPQQPPMSPMRHPKTPLGTCPPALRRMSRPSGPRRRPRRRPRRHQPAMPQPPANQPPLRRRACRRCRRQASMSCDSCFPGRLGTIAAVRLQLNLHLAPFGLLVCGSAACFSHMEPAPAEAQISPPAQVTAPATAGLPCKVRAGAVRRWARRAGLRRHACPQAARRATGSTRWG